MGDEEPISGFFEIEPAPKKVPTPLEKVENCGSTEDQYTESYKNIKQAADTGSDMLLDLSIMVGQTEDPRMIDAFTKLFKEVVVANEKLVELKGKKLEVQKAEGSLPEDDSPKTVNNNLFVGSTAEMLERMKDFKSNEETA